MTLYCLAWDNGLGYDDREVTDLGYYSTPEKREEAKHRYSEMTEQWPFCGGGGEKRFVESEATVDEDFVRKHRPLPV